MKLQKLKKRQKVLNKQKSKKLSSVIYYNDNFMSLDSFLLSESIKPKIIEYGTNEKFNNSKIFRINNVIGTSFKYNDKIYTITFDTNENEFGFYFVLLKDVDFTNFDYFNTILDEVDQVVNNPSNAAKIFGFVFHIILEIIEKYNLKMIKFNGANNKLDKFYTKLMQNKLFIDEFTKLNFEFSMENGYFVFKAK